MTEALSVVIAARDAAGTIADQLDALTDQPWPRGGEIIVADNGSRDATRDIVSARSKALGDDGTVTITLVDCAETPGAGHARNAGVAASTNEHVAFCDADDVVDQRWVAAMGNALDRHEAVGGRLALDRLNPAWVIDSRGSSLSADELPLFDGIFPVLSSCNLGIHRSLFDALGGFDESYLRGQDAELSLRLHEHGADTYFASDAVVNYRLRSSLRSVFIQARGWGEANARLRRRLSTHPPRRATLRSWLWLVANVPHLAQPAKRARWIYVAGLRIGLAKASMRNAWVGANR